MFRRFMYGRYGNDQLGNLILVIALIFGVVTIFVGGLTDLVFILLQYICLAFWAMRAFSRNIYRRRLENQKFLIAWNGFKRRFSGVSNAFARMKDREHRYFKCPKCKSRLRVPRGRGEITVTCPKCKNRFDKKS